MEAFERVSERMNAAKAEKWQMVNEKLRVAKCVRACVYGCAMEMKMHRATKS